ncbi:MAG: deoxyribose-phosphate aldolase [Lachnospiraceae bacterium]|nr:deoxyribose-phosphate aldolase [Lachnospiraceae bacterium]
MKLEKYLDYTILKPAATKADVENLCKKAIQLDTASVCINPCYVAYAKELLQDSNVKVCTVIGFPLGATDTQTKCFETRQAIANGATELDMVINVGALKDKNYDYVKNEIAALKEICKDLVLKVIIETCLLTDEEKIKVCELALEAGADFVKTSTGFGSHGATIEDVKLMKSVVKEKASVKASGGIRDSKTAKAMIDAGASRIGTSGLLD